MNRKYTRIQHSVTVGHAEWRRVRRQGEQPIVTKITTKERLLTQWKRMVDFATAVWNRMTKRQLALISLALGLFVGLVVLGWWLVPVEWDATNYTGSNFNNLPEAKRALVIENSAELFSYTLDQERVKALTADWPDIESDVCRLSAGASDPAEAMRYEALLYISTGRMCGE